MKTVQITLYEFDELSMEARDRAISDQINFEIETMNEDSPYYETALKMEEMKTPWFLGQEIYYADKDSIIETIKANGYFFTKEGKLS